MIQNDTKNDLPTFLIPMYLELKRRDSHKDLIHYAYKMSLQFLVNVTLDSVTS